MNGKKLKELASTLPTGLSEDDLVGLKMAYLALEDDRQIMVRVTPTAVKLKTKAKESRWEAMWKEAPRRDIAYRCWRICKEENPETWTTLVAVGAYMQGYRNWCKAHYDEPLTTVYLRIRDLCEEEGIPRVVAGIDALFTGMKLTWVDRKDLNFLILKWSRFIAPALVENTKRGGEQSEYKKTAGVKPAVRRRK